MTELDHQGAAELQAALKGCALADHGTLGRLIATGPDLLDLLQRLGTGDLSGLQPGEGRATVITTPKGRIVERVFAHHLGGDGILLVCGPDGAPRVKQHLDRFTFRERTGLADVTDSTCQLALIGPRAGDALAAAGFDRPEGCAVTEGSHAGARLWVLGGDGIGGRGATVYADAAAAALLRELLTAAVRSVGGLPVGPAVMESRRVLLGLPVSPHELNDGHNPLEAGLTDAISFDKGCYVGQEVIARLNTYDKVSRALVGLELPADGGLPAAGTGIVVEGSLAGRVTSAVWPPGWPHPVALAYLKQRAARPTVEIPLPGGVVRATVVELPFDVTAR
jgi:folate-binding protein YgfZ